jgi:hypothetical protein
MTAKPAPRMDHSERAARDLLNRKVREGVFDRRSANEVLKTGLPFVRTMLAEWRRDGMSPEWITAKFQEKRAEAEADLNTAANFVQQHIALNRMVCAEMYLAVWAGLQADYAQHLADTRKPEIA